MGWKRICRVAGINYSVKTCLHNCVQKMNQRPAECMATTEVFSGRKMAMQRDVTNLQRTMISHILSLIMVLCVVHIFHLDIGCYSLLTSINIINKRRCEPLNRTIGAAEARNAVMTELDGLLDHLTKDPAEASGRTACGTLP